MRRVPGYAPEFEKRWQGYEKPVAARKSAVYYITLDANAAWHRAVPEFKESGEILDQERRVRSCASLHHVVEPDHTRVKRRVNLMLGFQSFEKARVVIAGIELAQKISQRAYELRRWGGTDASLAHVWQPVMAA
jgi:transposase-like protein